METKGSEYQKRSIYKFLTFYEDSFYLGQEKNTSDAFHHAVFFKWCEEKTGNQGGSSFIYYSFSLVILFQLLPPALWSQTFLPIAIGERFEMNQDEDLKGDLSMNDEQLQEPIYNLISGSSKGNVVLTPKGIFLFTPFNNLCGETSFRYQVCNEGDINRCSEAEAKIGILNGNELGVKEIFSYCNIPVSGNINDYYDLPSGGIVTLESEPAQGVLQLQAEGIFTFIPLIMDCESIDFSFKICWADDSYCCRYGSIQINTPDTHPCDFYATIIDNNCCMNCPTGNLEIKTAYWKESYTNLTGENIALHKPAIFNGIPNFQKSNAFLSNDGQFEGESQTSHDYAFSNYGTNNYWDIDLVGRYDLESLHIHTKTNCCLGDATEYEIFISEVPFRSWEAAVLRGQADLFKQRVPINWNAPTILNNLSTIGRFVRIYLLGEGQMQLVEVELIGNGRIDGAPYEYNWSDSTIGNDSNPHCLAPGIYQVNVRDAATGCVVSLETVVE